MRSLRYTALPEVQTPQKNGGNRSKWVIAVCCIAAIFAGLFSKRNSLGDAGVETALSAQTVAVFQSSPYQQNALSLIEPAETIAVEECSCDLCACSETVGGKITVFSSDQRQKILGFGAAFTDAAALNFWRLPEAARDKVMDAYFGEQGIGYTVGRVPMDSTDFSIDQFNFNDVPGDYELKNFDTKVLHDQVEKIPMIREAFKRAPDLKLFISPWSPPSWMKLPRDGQQSMIQSAWPQGLLGDEKTLTSWALYFSKFITAYQDLGVKLWGLTVQNEPENPGPWEACVYNATFMADFIKGYLGPRIRQDHPDIKIISYDHNRDHLVHWTEAMVNDPDVAKYVDGMGFHWYFGGMDRGLDGSTAWGNLEIAYKLLGKDRLLMSTESCNCPYADHTFEGSLYRAEHVAHDMIADTNNWASSWVDWNILLNYEGGPNHAGNLCDAPIYCNKDWSDVGFQPMYYYMGHISRFATPGSTVLGLRAAGYYSHGGNRGSGVLVGYEAASYGCEGSVRQKWVLRDDGKMEMKDMMTEYIQYWAPVCLSRKVNKDTKAVTMVVCDGPDAGVFYRNGGLLVLDYAASFPPTDSTVDADEVTGSEDKDDVCLAAVSSEEGAVVTLLKCDSESPLQGWDELTDQQQFLGKATNNCLTAGWPFFTATAVAQKDGGYAVVVLNEASEVVPFTVSFPDDDITFTASIPAHAIQTYTF